MIYWTKSIDDLEKIIVSLEPIREVTDSFLQSKAVNHYHCVVCSQITKMEVSLITDSKVWTDLRGQFICEKCNMNARSRLLIEAVADQYKNESLLIFERITALYDYFRGDFGTKLKGCEYFGEGKSSGSIVSYKGVDVEHQDMMNLSYTDNVFDTLIHSDVLEHVPDYILGLRECQRVLKPGGQLVFSCPVYCQREHEKVAHLSSTGQVEFVGKEVFHGNPLSDLGSPVFTKHGYNLIEDLRSVGFSSAEFGFGYSPANGMLSNNNPYPVGLMWPIVFRATK